MLGDREDHEVKGDTRAKIASAFSVSQRLVFDHDTVEMCENRYECEKERLKRIWVDISTT